ncbi:terminase small subunit [Bacillus vallismortis]|uniref:terminase small subunit n=1 Tax=Bacillus vallismortis TaxID=72361 RepID=UPI000C2A40C1|nr:terminase small subunit [Bacillus vallismortis]PJZ00371.1 terminase small subunit [Bacillus vallismortis]
MSKLTPKQKRFVDEYLIDLNATQSYIRAGYKANSEAVAGVEGHKLLKNPKIEQAISEAMEKRSKRTNITADRVLNQLAKYAFADIRDLMTWNEETGRITLLPPDQIDGSIITELTQTVTEVPYGEEMMDKVTTKVKRGDPLKALELIGKHLGMFDPKNAHINELSKAQIEKMKADTELTKERIKLLKGDKGDTALITKIAELYQAANKGEGDGN